MEARHRRSSPARPGRLALMGDRGPRRSGRIRDYHLVPRRARRVHARGPSRPARRLGSPPPLVAGAGPPRARALEAVRSPARVLDTGCGWGVTLDALEAAGYRTSGLDVSRRALERLDRPNRRLIEADSDAAGAVAHRR